MIEKINTNSHFPWPTLIISCIYLIIELAYLFSKRGSFIVTTFREIFKILLYSVKEITSAEACDKLCGTIVITPIICMIGPICYMINLAFKENPNIHHFYYCTFLVLILIPLIIFSHQINRKVIVRK